MDNASASSDTGSNNRWDCDGEGNYWGDYDGSNKNGDGVGDTPYHIPPNGVDNYPLMTTWISSDN